MAHDTYGDSEITDDTSAGPNEIRRTDKPFDPEGYIEVVGDTRYIRTEFRFHTGPVAEEDLAGSTLFEPDAEPIPLPLGLWREILPDHLALPADPPGWKEAYRCPESGYGNASDV